MLRCKASGYSAMRNLVVVQLVHARARLLDLSPQGKDLRYFHHRGNAVQRGMSVSSVRAARL